MKDEAREIRRLHWGCGGSAAPGWINSDRGEYPGVDLVCDIRDGLPLPSDSIDYAVSIHALPEIPYNDLVPTLEELRRLLKPGGVLRLGLPDLDKGIDAYRRSDREYFAGVPDEDAESIGGKLITQLLWYGYARTLFVRDFVEEVLRKAGFCEVHHVSCRQTRSPYADIVELDNREAESLFVEAVK
jgi:SAM-dependent methyltransferase